MRHEQEYDLEPHDLAEHDDPSLDELRTPVWLWRAFLYVVMSLISGLGSLSILAAGIALEAPVVALASGPLSFLAMALAIVAIVAGSIGAREGGALNAALGVCAVVVGTLEVVVWFFTFNAWIGAGIVGVGLATAPQAQISPSSPPTPHSSSASP